MNGFIRVVGAVAGVWFIYFAYKAFSKEEFTLRGSFYSLDSTPLFFFIGISAFFAIGAYMIYNAIVGDSDTDSDG